MSAIKVRGKQQRVAIINQNKVLAKAVRYSTVKSKELISNIRITTEVSQ